MELGLPARREAGEEALGVGAHGGRSYRSEPPRPRIPAERLWLRAAAFGLDLLLLGGSLLLVATALVFGLLVTLAEPPAGIGTIFHGAQVLFVVLFLVRDAGGASPGKRVFGLRTASVVPGRGPLLASVGRNLPLLVPGWNLVEALLVFRRDQRRPGDRIGGTAVLEA